jgi:hypothetical protein
MSGSGSGGRRLLIDGRSLGDLDKEVRGSGGHIGLNHTLSPALPSLEARTGAMIAVGGTCTRLHIPAPNLPVVEHGTPH